MRVWTILDRTMLAALVAALVGCTERALEAPRNTAWDSAGVEIVLNNHPVWTDLTAWQLTSKPLFVLRATDGSEEGRLLDPVSIDVDSEGRIIVADGDQFGWDAVLVYNREGSFLKKVGRPGKGPGEFEQLWWASAYRGDSIIGFDVARGMVSVFDPDGRFARQVRNPSIPTDLPPRGTYWFTPGIDAAFRNGDFLAYPIGTLDISEGIGPAWYKHLLFRVRPDGIRRDTLGVFKIYKAYWNGTRQERLWFTPHAVAAVWEDDLYFGTGEFFEIRRYGHDGNLKRLIRRSYTPVPVGHEYRDLLREWYRDQAVASSESVEQGPERLQAVVEAARLADTLPAYSSILVNEGGHLWVGEFQWSARNARSPIQRPTDWSVFDTAGVWLGDVEVPAGFIVHEVTDDRVLGFVIDEFEVKEVHVYGLEKGGG